MVRMVRTMKMLMTRAVMVSVLAGSFIVVPALARAQATPPPGGQRHRMELEQRLHAGFGQMVRSRLGLDPDELAALQRVMMSFQEDRLKLNQARGVLRFRLREQALQSMPEEEARTLLQEMIRLQEEELGLYRREQQQLLQVLTPLQLVRFYGLRENLGQQVQEVRQGRGPGRGPGGGGPGGISGGPGGGVGGPGGFGIGPSGMESPDPPSSVPDRRRFFR